MATWRENGCLAEFPRKRGLGCHRKERLHRPAAISGEEPDFNSKDSALRVDLAPQSLWETTPAYPGAPP